SVYTLRGDWQGNGIGRVSASAGLRGVGDAALTLRYRRGRVCALGVRSRNGAVTPRPHSRQGGARRPASDRTRTCNPPAFETIALAMALPAHQRLEGASAAAAHQLLRARMVPAALHTNPKETLASRNEQRLLIRPTAELYVRRGLRRRDIGQLFSGGRKDMNPRSVARNGAVDVAVPVHADPIGPDARRKIHHGAAEFRRAV